MSLPIPFTDEDDDGPPNGAFLIPSTFDLLKDWKTERTPHYSVAWSLLINIRASCQTLLAACRAFFCWSLVGFAWGIYDEHWLSWDMLHVCPLGDPHFSAHVVPISRRKKHIYDKSPWDVCAARANIYDCRRWWREGMRKINSAGGNLFNVGNLWPFSMDGWEPLEKQEVDREFLFSNNLMGCLHGFWGMCDL